MGDYSGSADVGAPAGQLFDYLSEISNLPRYFTTMTSAEPAGQDEVHVVADVDGVTREGEAWFRVDRERRHLEWGSEGPDNYHGYLDVAGDGARASVAVFLHTERVASSPALPSLRSPILGRLRRKNKAMCSAERGAGRNRASLMTPVALQLALAIGEAPGPGRDPRASSQLRLY